MIAISPLWRVPPWIGAVWRDLKVRMGGRKRGWQDKSCAVGWGAGICFYEHFSASHARTLLARFANIGVISPFPAPSPALL